ncbi:MAG: DUF374 domain-containing protein [Opitutales bacterium]|jgi:lysophospholipid acyltransferase (LPLAT)-like uncharacterized protein
MKSDPAQDSPVQVPWFHWIWVAPVALLLRLWLATLRFRANPGRFDDAAGPRVVVLWHENLFVTVLVAQRCLARKVTALISSSKDGAWLVAFYRLMGVAAVRGSSNRGGVGALMALTRAVRAGAHAGVTPDGPKGPRRVVKPGVATLARLTAAPFLILGIRHERAWSLSSWDRFRLPVPFSKVEVDLVELAPPGVDETDEQTAARVERKLAELSRD